MSGSVSAIIFDIGNVLIEWDMRLLYRKIFNDEAAIDRFITETNLWAWNIEQDRGRSWAEAEHDLISHYPHYEAEIKAFRACWHDMVPGPISGSVTLKAKLHELGVPLYAITNFASDTFREAQERFSFLYEFRDIVVSGAEGLIKPDPAIYQLCLERNDLEANACLFIDDSLNNIKGAQKVGLQTHHFTSPDLLAEDLRRRGFDV